MRTDEASENGCLMASSEWDRLWGRPTRSPTQGDGYYANGGRSVHLRYVVPMLEEIDLRGASFVELGCGTGLLTRCLFDVLPVRSAVALDFSPKALEKARANCCDRDVEVVRADVLTWDTSARFDLTVSIGLIEHFHGPALVQAVARHADLLKDGGHAIICCPRLGPLWPALRVINLLQGIREEPPSDGRLVEIVESVGLRVQKVKRYGVGLLLAVLARKETA